MGKTMQAQMMNRNVNTHKHSHKQGDNHEMGMTMQAQMMNSNVNPQTQSQTEIKDKTTKWGREIE